MRQCTGAPLPGAADGRQPSAATRRAGSRDAPTSLPRVSDARVRSPLLALASMAADRQRIEEVVHDAVRSSDPYLTEIASHLVVAGGKRLRPVVAIAAAQVGGEPASLDVVRGGVACELVHLGSLYHDDVIDEADTRRGVETVNAKWGNLQAILAGDFLLARASEIAASLGTEVAGLLARTIGWLCEGEIEQLRHTYDVGRPEESYLASIQGKTASLYGTAARIGGIVAGLDRPTIDGAHRVGQRLRDGVPDRRRHPRHHRQRRAARQAGRPRPRRGRLHAAGAAHVGPRPVGRRGAGRPARPPARRRRAGQGAGDRAGQRGRRQRRGHRPPVRRRRRGGVRRPAARARHRRPARRAARVARVRHRHARPAAARVVRRRRSAADACGARGRTLCVRTRARGGRSRRRPCRRPRRGRARRGAAGWP